ncbi:MAG TPA: HRDC domain-containing protein, partial [Spirochaetota bacterium]|nr:HRDC domain-containing protein [Spirochaetota bacterium]HQP48276.1 HRDC domain-containing protein [Spirochaetota bacterium]
EKAYSVMKGEAQFFGVSIDEYGTTSGKADSRQYDTGLFSILRTKRKEIADIDGVPPYIVFSDRSLMEMASYYPRSREAFLEIHGVGSGKWDKYGEIFSEVISEYCIENDIAEKRKLPKSGTKKPGEYRHQTVGRAYNEGSSVEELMAEYGVTRSTILNHLARYHIEEEKIRAEGIIPLLQLPDAMKEKIFSAFHEIGHDRMKSVFEHLEGHVDYEDLHLYRLAFMLEAESGIS